MRFEIITDLSVYGIIDRPESEYEHLKDMLVDEQDETLTDYGFENDCYTAYVIQYSDGEIRLDTIDDAIQSLALKDGADLVRFDDDTIGFVGYYNGFELDENYFKILRVPTEMDEKNWFERKEIMA